MEWILTLVNELDKILGPQISFLSSVLGILTAITSIVIFIIGLARRLLGRRKHIAGIYLTIATEFKTNQRFIHDLMEIKRTPFGYKGRTVHLIDVKRNQMIRFKTERGTEVFRGEWKNRDDGTRGFLKLSFDNEENMLHGVWVGEENKASVNGGEWIFIKLPDYRRTRNLLEFLKTGDETKPASDPQRLERIIQKHKAFADDHFDYDGMKFNVSKETFIPPLGVCPNNRF